MVCGKKASVYVSYLGDHLCAEHFVEYFERRVYDTIVHFRLVEEGDRVAVAVSGGKDSLTTLYLLSKFAGRLGIKVFGVAVDEGIAGYREYKLEALRNLARKLGVEIYVGSFKDYFGFTLDEAVKKLKERGLVIKPCSVCGVFRRYVMNAVAREHDASKLATGHNLDDETQVFVMNALKSHIDGILREGIISDETSATLVPRIKPLYLIPEKEVLTYTLIMNIYTPFVECPYIVYAMRHPIRHWVNEVEDEDPGFKYRLLASKELARKKIKAPYKQPTYCKVCGEPSTNPICKTCLYRAYLDEKYKELVEEKMGKINFKRYGLE